MAGMPYEDGVFRSGTFSSPHDGAHPAAFRAAAAIEPSGSCLSPSFEIAARCALSSDDGEPLRGMRFGERSHMAELQWH